MAQGRKYETESSGNGPAWVMAAVMVCGFLVFGAWLLVVEFPKGIALTDPAPSGAVGRQAPVSAVRRTNSAPAGQAAAPIPGVAQNQAEADAMYQAAIDAGNAAPPAALPLNSQGEPVIDASQQAQQQQSLALAEQEGAAAADAQLAAQRAAANAEALSRPPDVSYEDAKALFNGRDPCSIPRANPATCAKGLYKPTPVR